MVLNYIFVFFFIIAFIFALIRLLGYYFNDFFTQYLGITFDSSDAFVFKDIIDSTFTMAETSVGVIITLIGIMSLWLGIMRIGEEAGAIQALSKRIAPFFQQLFPEIPKNHPVFGSMLMNFSANMLGLDNAATPMGIKAIKELQTLNPKKDTASNAQIMFLILNTSGLTLIPVSVLALRADAGAQNPTDVFIPILLATFASTIGGLVYIAIRQKINLFAWPIFKYLFIIFLVIAGIVYYFFSLPQDKVNTISVIAANFIIFSIIIIFILLAYRRKINVFNAFITGAKDGFKIAVEIIPYLVAMLVAIGVFRASGAMDVLVQGLKYTIGATGCNTDFADALPTAFMKPLSGSGARGMMVEAMDTFGADSFVGRLVSVFQGSTETTFYTLAVYFGAIRIKNTRYTVWGGLFADFIGIIAAILIAYLFFH